MTNGNEIIPSRGAPRSLDIEGLRNLYRWQQMREQVQKVGEKAKELGITPETLNRYLGELDRGVHDELLGITRLERSA